MRSWNFSILLLLYGYVQCLASLDNPVEDIGIFTEDLCRDVQNHKKLVNPFDPNGYFECFKGETLEKNCAGKRVFNPEMQKCVSNRKTSTKPESSLKHREPSSLVSKYRLLPKSLQKTITTKKPRRFIREIRSEEPELTNCQGQQSWIKLPYPGSCQKYYLCILEVTYTRDCPNDLWFDEVRQDCVPPRESRCINEAPEAFCEGVPNFHKLESPYYCEEYYMCVNEIPFYYRCDNNQYFDQLNQRCDKPDNVDCNLDLPDPPEDICENVPNFKYIASPYSCSHYYQCIFERPYVMRCPNGELFDEEKQGCRNKGEVECESRQTISRI